jgi:hypothetical protein
MAPYHIVLDDSEMGVICRFLQIVSHSVLGQIFVTLRTGLFVLGESMYVNVLYIRRLYFVLDSVNCCSVIYARTHDLSRRAAEDLRFRPRGHWDRHLIKVTKRKLCVLIFYANFV